MASAASSLTARFDNSEAARVPRWLDRLSGFIASHPRFCIRLGNLETRYLADRLAAIAIERPIYIAGLARAGTTIVLEVIASHPGIATHRYRDFPAILMPYIWNQWLELARVRETAPTERAHRDGIIVTSQSPEAMEEMIWTAFFEELHDPHRGSVLDTSFSQPGFEKFYQEHLKKLLLIRRGRRYASKENYNLTRLLYLTRMFADARLVIPVRHPVAHIASLIKEHRLFLQIHRAQPNTLAHFQRVGHFEFGADRRAINTGDTDRVKEIENLWLNDELRGWARYWAMIHDFVADQLDAHPALREAALIMRFEDLCDEPRTALQRLADHCALDGDLLIDKFADRLRAPTYYKPQFSASELAIIDEETRSSRRRFGYD